MGDSQATRARRSDKLVTASLLALLVVGVLVFCYPVLSDVYNNWGMQRAVQTYDSEAARLSREERAQLLADAEAYNAELAASVAENPAAQGFANGAVTDERYATLLDVDGQGMMGYVTINKLNVNLPIYHGTDEDDMAHGVGHLEGSSLPVGGASTHAVITGHRGLPTATLFTNLDQLEEGDSFSITVLDRTVAYTVDQILIVEPEDTTALTIEPEGDYVTLLTCTPFAVNTHRLLVRGVRSTGAPLVVEADAWRLGPLAGALVVAALLVLVAAVAVGVVLVVRFVRGPRGGVR